MITSKSEQLAAAIRKAANILSYSDNTRAKLIQKLRRAGFEADVCEEASREMVDRGLLREDRQLIHAIEYMAEVKLFGRRRIYMELVRRGFSQQLVEDYAEGAMANVDFVENCYKLAQKQHIEPTEAGRMKLSRALVRYGFSGDEIRCAVKRLNISWRGTENSGESDTEFSE